MKINYPYDYHNLIPAIAPAPHELGGWPRRHKSIGIACSRSSWLATPPNDKQTQHVEHYVCTPHCMPTSHDRVPTTPPAPPELGRRPRRERVPILAHARIFGTLLLPLALFVNGSTLKHKKSIAATHVPLTTASQACPKLHPS